MSKKRSVTNSFGYALQGFKEAFKNEPNFRIHILCAMVTSILSLFLGLSPAEWSMLVLVIGLVIILELVNTAVEKIVDLVSPEYSYSAKVAKDVSAAAVLTSAVIALSVGIFIFVPKIVMFLYF